MSTVNAQVDGFFLQQQNLFFHLLSSSIAPRAVSVKKRNFASDQQQEDIWISTEHFASYADFKKNYWSITLNCREIQLLELPLRKAHTNGDRHNHLGRGQVETTLHVPAGPGKVRRGLISPLCCFWPALPFVSEVLSAPGPCCCSAASLWWPGGQGPMKESSTQWKTPVCLSLCWQVQHSFQFPSKLLSEANTQRCGKLSSKPVCLRNF